MNDNQNKQCNLGSVKTEEKSSQKQAKPKSIKKQLLTIFLVVATELIGFGLIIPILPLIGAKYQVNTLMLGVLMASYSFMQFIAAPILGALSDKYGRKPVLVLSKLGTVFAYALLAISQSYWLILVSRLIDGFTGGNITTARAYVSDITTPENRSKGMAIIGISFGVGFILGPSLGSVLYGTQYGYMLPAAVAGGLSFVAMILTIFLIEEPEHRTKTSSALKQLVNGGKLFKNRTVLLVCALQMMFLVMFSGFETSFAFYTNKIFGYDAQQNSVLFVYVGLLALFIQGYFSRKTVNRFKGRISVGIICALIGLGAMGVLSNIWILLIALAFLSLGFSLVNTYLPSLMSVVLPENLRGVGMGIYEGVGSLSRIIGPLVGFALISFSLRGFYLILAGALVIGVCLFMLLYKDIPQVESNDSTT
ncbi:MFS transporter [bacterium]|jgi:MFS transporter, DHA1 family, tetracycline resistance protein|nr:MFS transporter [bacterium]